MVYCKDKCKFQGIIGYIYYEVVNKYVYRQIGVFENKIVSSNRNNGYYNFWLVEGEFNINLYDKITIIEKAEFEEIWSKNNEQYLNEWNEIKSIYTKEIPVKGVVDVLYPQGVIMSTDDKVLCISDYEYCKKQTYPQTPYPGNTIKGVVKGYDEINMWLIIG